MSYPNNPGVWAMIALALAVAPAADAQLAPNAHWRTITTAHFRVSFSDSLEATARRAAGSAERAHASLSKELAEPRGMIDLVVADNLDLSNGYATPFPSNRIVIYARPTIDANSLKFLDDWIDLVVTHELAHIFHLDRTRGLWRLGQWVFGRNPFLFPNSYSPSWLTEAIAVHYESKLTGAGRALGTDFDAIVRAHEHAGTAPRLSALSAATPLYPLGSLAYTYGSQLLEKAASRGGPGAMREFVDVSAGRIIPFMMNTNAKRAFGITFDSAFVEWSDSSHHEAQRVLRGSVPPKTLVANGWFSSRPRWVDEHTLIYAGADPKSVPSLREVAVPAASDTAQAAQAAVRVVAPRNSSDATTPLPNGWRVFAQQEYTSPYAQRSDLWVEHDGAPHRLTTGARILHPDATVCTDEVVANQPAPDRPTFCVVAVQLLPGIARLVYVRASADGQDVTIKPLTPASVDDLYSEPRWSHDRTRIVAAHWMRGGTSELTIFARDGRVIQSLGRSRAVVGTPAWGAGDTTIFFTSDRSGRAALYRADLNSGAVARIADSPTALFDNEPSPDGLRLATFVLGANGLDLAVVPALPARATPADSTSVLPPSRGTPVATSDALAGSYSAWRTVLPRYWEPVVEQGFRDETRYGLALSGSDVVERHRWALNATQGFKSHEAEADAAYSFAGLGQPVIGVGLSQAWDHPGVPDSARKVLLAVARQRRFANLSTSFVRRRVSSSLALTIGGSYEWRAFRALDEYPFSRFSPADRTTLGKRYTYPSFVVGAGYSNARQPYLALGPENGFTASVALRQRWRSDLPSATRANSMVGTVTGYRAFDFGGRFHHLLAARFAVARADLVSATDFTAGGNSGGTMQLVPGVSIGDGRRTFFVRGFEVDALTGSDAMGTNIEYRLPIALPARGLWNFPVYFQRVSAVFFADAATAYCRAGAANSPICFKPTAREWIGSSGAELHFDTALQYDSPYRFRLGVAVPTQGRRYFGASGVAAYFTVGLPF